MLKPSHDDGRKQSEQLFLKRLLCLAGYRAASVIIALTDGELRENQFDMAQREVRKRARGGIFLSTAPLFMEGCFSRRAEHASWAPPFTALA